MDPCFNLIYKTELGEGRLSQIMEAMLALLLTDETDWLLFRTFFLARLPNDIHDRLVAGVGR